MKTELMKMSNYIKYLASIGVKITRQGVYKQIAGNRVKHQKIGGVIFIEVELAN